ncbi:hypothetical protein GCM10027018_04530 [Paenibacillus thermoaerophilus]
MHGHPPGRHKPIFAAGAGSGRPPAVTIRCRDIRRQRIRLRVGQPFNGHDRFSPVMHENFKDMKK